jgi:hypothetical protein
VLLADELATRLIPHRPDEGAYARNRHPAERPPWPKVGDEVYFRQYEWDLDEDLHRMRVVAVQDPGDVDSAWASNLVQHLRHNVTGAPLHYPDGRPVLVPLEDPLPWVHLRWEGDVPKGSGGWMRRPQMTFESRLRGSPGWLPLNYRQIRRVHLPGQILHRPATAWRYQRGALECDRGDGVWQPFP